jgi:hypothetical protein
MTGSCDCPATEHAAAIAVKALAGEGKDPPIHAGCGHEICLDAATLGIGQVFPRWARTNV